MNPSNIERTGDRDLYWSGLLRRTRDVRQCDHDFDSLETRCDHCKLCIAFIEATRDRYEYKPTTYQVAESKNGRFERPVYCITHDGSLDHPATFFNIERRYLPVNHAGFPDDGRLKSEQEFIEWVQNLYKFHLTICPSR